MDNSIRLQGSFTSDGKAKTIFLRSGVDWMRTYNITVMDDAQTVAIGSEFYWQAGMADGHGIEYKKSNAANAANLVDFIHTGGFTEFSSQTAALGLPLAVNAISNAAIPVVTTGVNHTINAGDTIRLINIVGGQQISGMDFTVGQNTLGAATFSLDYMPQIVAATTGFYRYVPVAYAVKWYPRTRYITNITQTAQAVVTLSVDVLGLYEEGQQIRLVVPSEFGMVEMNGLTATILDVTVDATHNDITLDIDSLAFTAFAFPVTADVPFTFAQVIPIGEDTAEALSQHLDILADATDNVMTMGMILAAGADSPAGQDDDVIYWEAGTSFSVDNE